MRTGVTMVQSEGFSALMSGVSATVARGVFYGGAPYLLVDSAILAGCCRLLQARHTESSTCCRLHRLSLGIQAAF